jgi:predicted PurR-regulated permease PerM
MEIKPIHTKFLIILAMLILSYTILKPYFITLIIAAITAYLLWPAHKIIRKKIGEFSSALVLTLFTVSLLVIGIYYGINLLLEESANFYLLLSKLNLERFGPNFHEVSRLLTTRIINEISDQVVNILNILISTIIFFVSLFYFLKQGEFIYYEIVKNLPFEATQRKKIIKNITTNLDAFVHVQIVIGIVQGILATLGFWFFGLPYPVLAGFVAGMLSILPVIGPYGLYLPVGIFAYYSYGWSIALGIIIYGLTIGSIMDYLIRPVFYGKKANIHPLTTFLGIFGGMEAFGFVGIIIGPIILSIAIALIQGLRNKNGK